MAKENLGLLKNLIKAPVKGKSLLSHASRLLPSINPFLTGAYAAGYAADEIIDFLRNQIGSDQAAESELIQERMSAGVSTPRERVTEQSMRRDAAPIEGLQRALSLGTRAAGGLGALLGEKKASEAEKIERAQEEDRQQALKEEEANQAREFRREQQQTALQARKELAESRAAERKEASEEKKKQPTVEPLSKAQLEKIDPVVNRSLPKLGADDTRSVLVKLFGSPATKAYESIRGTLEEIEASLKTRRKPQKKKSPKQSTPRQIDMFSGTSDQSTDPVLAQLSQIAAMLRGG